MAISVMDKLEVNDKLNDKLNKYDFSTKPKPIRRVKIVYTYSFDDNHDKPCEAILRWSPTGRKSDMEVIVGHGKSFLDARVAVIQKYLHIPESEDVILDANGHQFVELTS